MLTAPVDDKLRRELQLYGAYVFENRIYVFLRERASDSWVVSGINFPIETAFHAAR